MSTAASSPGLKGVKDDDYLKKHGARKIGKDIFKDVLRRKCMQKSDTLMKGKTLALNEEDVE